MTERISKSAMKRRFKEEEGAAAELADLSDRDLGKLEVGDDLKREVIACRGLKGGSRKRQIKYLAKVMREDDPEAVFAFLAERKGSKLKENKLQREAERLRDVIINEAIEFQQEALQMGEVFEPDWPGDEIEAVAENYPVDANDLRKAVYQYVRSRVHNHYKEVFRIIKAAIEKSEVMKKLA